MQGTIVNALAVLAGGALGILLRRRIPAGMRDTVMHGLGLATIIIGVQMALGARNIVLVILSLVAGGVIGEALRIETGLERLGRWAEETLGASEEGSTFARAFVTSSLLFCVGPLTILGSIQGGLGQTPVLLYTKSMLDGASSVAIGAALGAGVLLSAGTVLVYQGALTLLASAAQTAMSPAVTREFTATGGMLVVGIGLNILGVRRIPIRVGNLLPALFLIVLLMALAPSLSTLAHGLGLVH